MVPQNTDPVSLAAAATAAGQRWSQLAWRVALSIAFLWLILQLH